MLEKFRVWVPSENKMFMVRSIIFTEEGKVSQIEYFDDNRTVTVKIGQGKLMQSIGFRDYHKTEIFEGDFIRFAREYLETLPEEEAEKKKDYATLVCCLRWVWEEAHTHGFDLNQIEVFSHMYASPEEEA